MRNLTIIGLILISSWGSSQSWIVSGISDERYAKVVKQRKMEEKEKVQELLSGTKLEEYIESFHRPSAAIVSKENLLDAKCSVVKRALTYNTEKSTLLLPKVSKKQLSNTSRVFTFSSYLKSQIVRDKKGKALRDKNSGQIITKKIPTIRMNEKIDSSTERTEEDGTLVVGFGKISKTFVDKSELVSRKSRLTNFVSAVASFRSNGGNLYSFQLAIYKRTSSDGFTPSGSSEALIYYGRCESN